MKRGTAGISWFSSPITGARAGALALALGVALPAGVASAQSPLVMVWERQIGTSATDFGSGVAVDGAGNAYITGSTNGSLGGPGAGGSDVYLAKYDASGALLWTRQVGSTVNDFGFGVAVDGAGNVYIAGATWGSLFGPNAGSRDIFLAKYDASGAVLWTRQFGTPGRDRGRSVAVDSADNVFVAGTADDDVLLAKYDASGTLLWTRQVGTSGDEAFGVALDNAGNAYIAGSTTGSLGGPNAGNYDAFLAKYDASGTLLWMHQAGTSGHDLVYGVAVDSAGNAYITGSTTGSLGGPNAGDWDAFLAKYGPSGTLLWTRQHGTSVTDEGSGVAVDGAGNPYISGYTTGSLGGPNAGDGDAFLAKYDASGALIWTRQFGTSASDIGYGVAMDGAGKAYITGSTDGSLGGPNAGYGDAFLAKYGACYPDCNGDALLNLADFGCFMTKFALQDTYADCNGDGALNLADFGCFQTKFAVGCK